MGGRGALDPFVSRLLHCTGYNVEYTIAMES